MRKRYTIGKFTGRGYIHDDYIPKIFGFGPGLDFSCTPSQEHRALYTEVDAIHLIEWLNERNAGYPTGPTIPSDLRR